MTKVRVPSSVRRYRRAMDRRVARVRRQIGIAGLQRCSGEEPSRSRRDVVSMQPGLAGLLNPPAVERLAPCIFVRDGWLDGIVQVRASGEFGVRSVYVIVTDARGNRLESDHARRARYPGEWGYIPSAVAGACRPFTVHVIVTDYLGGLRMRSKRIPV